MPWQTLLVPHDYSPCAEHALRVAAELARLHEAKIVLLHVTDLPPGLTADALVSDRDSGDMVRVDAYASAMAMRELEQRAAPLRAAGHRVEVSHALGDVAATILEVAGVVHADVIVMGTHGRTGLAQWFLGSRAEKVMREATVPVLTVRDRPEGRRATHEVVVPDLATD